MRFFRQLSLGILFIGLAAAGARAEQVDNPNYQAWAKHKPGTTVVFKNDMAMTGMTMSMTMSQTLKDMKTDKAVIEVTGKMDLGGVTRDMPAQSQDVAAKVEKGQENLPAEFKGETKEVGKETIDVMGKKIECTVLEFTGQASSNGRGPSGPVKGKLWMSSEIPGRMVKMEASTEVQGQGTVNMTRTVTSIEEGK